MSTTASSTMGACTPKAFDLQHHFCEVVALFKHAIDLDALRLSLQKASFPEITFHLVCTDESRLASKGTNLEMHSLYPQADVLEVSRAYLRQCDEFVLQADEKSHLILRVEFPQRVGGSKDQAWNALRAFHCYYAVYYGLWEPWKSCAKAKTV